VGIAQLTVIFPLDFFLGVLNAGATLREGVIGGS